MRTRWTLQTAMVAVALSMATASTAVAASPWSKLLTAHRVEADPEKEYRLTEECGPWLIFACSFSGEGAEEQARELVLEFRDRYKLLAYRHVMSFDLEQADGRGLNRYGGPLRMRYRRGDEVREVAVLVGDYPAVDDPEAQEILERIKHYHPDCLKPDESRPTKQNLAAWRMLANMASDDESDKLGPMSKAFITTNPLLPREYFVPSRVDPEVIEWNKNLKYSLLNCKGQYTVQIATFKGKVLIKQDKIAAIERGDAQLDSSLDEAADTAHKLTVALRMKGYDAYEFHERHASIVCVGSFDTVGKPRQDGKIEINPKIHLLMKKFGARQVNMPGKPSAMEPKSFVGIPLDIQPIPVKVPKASISATLGRGGLLR